MKSDDANDTFIMMEEEKSPQNHPVPKNHDEPESYYKIGSEEKFRNDH